MNTRPSPPLSRFENDVWKVEVSRVGTFFHVAPSKGLCSVGNWALNPYQRRGLGAFLANVWRMFSGAYLRSEYPKSERRLERAIRECEAFCSAENEGERKAKAVLASRAAGHRD